MEIVNKISTKTICGKVEAPKEGGHKHLFNVMGIVTGTKRGESNYGAWISFTGLFRATRHDGEMFQASSLFLPDAATNMLLAAMESGNSASAEIAVNIGMKHSDAPIGYEYTVKPIIETADPLAELAARVQAALPAPKTGGKEA